MQLSVYFDYLPLLLTNRIYVKLSPNLKILKVYNKYSQVFNVE